LKNENNIGNNNIPEYLNKYEGSIGKTLAWNHSNRSYHYTCVLTV